MRVDRLTIDAVVKDNFSSTLNDLIDKLIDIDLIASSTVEDINADVDITKAMAELKTLKSELRDVEDISVGDREAVTMGTVGGDGGRTIATPDGGSSGGGRDLSELVLEARNSFGNAFDSSVLADNPKRTQRLTDLLEGSPSKYIDTKTLTDRLVDPNDDTITDGLVENLLSDNDSKSTSAFRTLRRNGLTDLPTREGFFSRNLGSFGNNVDSIFESIKGFDATALNNLRASLFPLLATFIGALPAAIGGLLGLAAAAVAAAAALGGVLAIGALGVSLSDGIELTDILDDLRESLKEALGPIAESLRPTFLAGVDSVEQFFQGLGKVSEQLRSLSDDALDVLDIAEQFVLSGLANVIRFGEITIELFRNLSSELDGFSLTKALADVLATTIDELILFANAVIRLTPFIINLSEGFLAFVGIVLTLFGVLGQLLSRFPFLTQVLGITIATILTLVSATLLLSGAKALLGKTILTRTIPAFIGLLGSLKSAILGIYAATVASYGLITALVIMATLVTIITGGLALLSSVAISAASDWNVLGAEIGSARRELKKFSRSSGPSTSFGGGSRSGQSQYTNYVDQSQTTFVAPDKETGGSISRRHQYDQQVAEQHTS